MFSKAMCKTIDNLAVARFFNLEYFSYTDLEALCTAYNKELKKAVSGRLLALDGVMYVAMPKELIDTLKLAVNELLGIETDYTAQDNRRKT